jgi:hypothetical protein
VVDREPASIGLDGSFGGPTLAWFNGHGQEKGRCFDIGAALSGYDPGAAAATAAGLRICVLYVGWVAIYLASLMLFLAVEYPYP